MVDECFVLDEAKEAGRLIAPLRTRCHGTNLNEAKSQAQEFVHTLSVFIKPGGEADGICKVLSP